MTVLIDTPRWPAHGRLWSHLVSDVSHAELHAFARSCGIPERGFDHDHYDVPGERYPDLVAAGAVPVDSRELLRRLTAAGLRRPRRDRRPGRAQTPPATTPTASPDALSIAAVHWDDGAVAALREAQQGEIQAIYRAAGRVDQEFGVVPTAADVMVTVLATVAGKPVACGALRRLDQNCGEVKRMYVVPGWRGRGLARAVLADLERRALRYGWSVLRLETGQLLDDAIGLYTRAGFVGIERFGHYAGNPNSVCFEKHLDRTGGEGPKRGPDLMATASE